MVPYIVKSFILIYEGFSLVLNHYTNDPNNGHYHNGNEVNDDIVKYMRDQD